ncbi:BPL-N domain-containing protein [Pseudonocardia sp. H11422]|uniref:BPL-N domain-containing protein n=1 Tax=Pseudonocardia sp. H11422 TaxID=2835866 RepID=UPI0020293891|nr:BPL-N domain-containing protein [Pseudonocardia sp. H11422]
MGERALIYRGPAACEGCAEAVAALLRSCPRRFDVSYAGPADLELTATSLRSAALYAQPGGGNSVRKAYRQMRRSAPAIRDYVWSGGRYLGICMGAYLAGTWRGFGFLPDDTDQFITSPGADVTIKADTIVRVDWRGRRRHMFFQDGTVFPIGSHTPDVTVLARYASNGAAAAVVAPFGQGRIGVCGPHPEAPSEWYEAHDLTNPDGIRADLGHDLIETLMS